MYKKTPAAHRSTQHATLKQGAANKSPLSREPYYTDVRHLLSRRAKAFLKLMEGQLPEDAMMLLTRELAAEPRRDQNVLAQQLFNILINSAQFYEPEDERLWLKLDDLASMVCCNADLREPSNDECYCDWT